MNLEEMERKGGGSAEEKNQIGEKERDCERKFERAIYRAWTQNQDS